MRETSTEQGLINQFRSHMESFGFEVKLPVFQSVAISETAEVLHSTGWFFNDTEVAILFKSPNKIMVAPAGPYRRKTFSVKGPKSWLNLAQHIRKVTIILDVLGYQRYVRKDRMLELFLQDPDWSKNKDECLANILKVPLQAVTAKRRELADRPMLEMADDLMQLRRLLQRLVEKNPGIDVHTVTTAIQTDDPLKYIQTATQIEKGP